MGLYNKIRAVIDPDFYYAVLGLKGEGISRGKES